MTPEEAGRAFFLSGGAALAIAFTLAGAGFSVAKLLSWAYSSWTLRQRLRCQRLARLDRDWSLFSHLAMSGCVERRQRMSPCAFRSQEALKRDQEWDALISSIRETTALSQACSDLTMSMMPSDAVMMSSDAVNAEMAKLKEVCDRIPAEQRGDFYAI